MIKRTLQILFVIFSVTLFAQQKKYELTKLEFTGNKLIPSENLSSVIYSKQSPGWLWQTLNKVSSIGGKAIYFDSLLIRSDLEVLKDFYRSRGFFKAKFKSSFVLNEEDGTAKLSFNIDEGPPVYFHSMTIRGCELVAQEFQAVIWEGTRVDTTKFFEENIVEEKKNFALTFLRNNGYMLAYVDKPRVVIDTIKNIVDIEIRYHTGKRYKISDLYTTRTGKGMDLVDDQLIKELVGLKQGNWYSNSDLQRAQVRLYRTNLFESAVINSVITDTVGNTVPLNINTDIGLMNDLSPEMIMNDEDGSFNLGASLNFTRKNFLGGARKLTVGASLAAQNVSKFIQNPTINDTTFYGYADARVSFEQPFLFGYPVNFKLESYYTKQRRKSEGYNAILFGSKFGFDFELSDKVYLNTLNTYLNIERSEYTYEEKNLIKLVSNFYKTRLGFPKDEAENQARDFVQNMLQSRVFASTNAIIGLNMGANKTNDFLYPTKGYYLNFLFENANSLAYIFNNLFGKDFTRPQTVKSVVTATWFPNVYNTKTDAFGLKIKTGQIFTYSGQRAEIPISQRLYAGGSNSVRGWGTRELVPSDPLINFTSLSQEDIESLLVRGAATGGLFLFEGSIETRHKFLGDFGATFFVDYGNTWNDYSEFRVNQIAVAVGAGFRFYTSLIPFRFDFGLKAYNPNDKRSILKKGFWKDVLQIHIGIGEAF